MSARARLLEWVSQAYTGRKIRISGEPYLEHLLFVANTVSDLFPLAYEAGLCHDVLEDLNITEAELQQVLTELGYSENDGQVISTMVKELTSEFTKAHFPALSKKERHALEDDRLRSLSTDAQTIKYADILYNAEWTVQHEPDMAAAYLEGKQRLLEGMTRGDALLWRRTMTALGKLQT